MTVADARGTEHRWHVLDNRAEPRQGTMLCVHGNPTWSYLWRRFLSAAPSGWRVVAVDQLGMGWSERLPRGMSPREWPPPRRLADRILDLGDLTAALELDGPVVTVGHDWGVRSHSAGRWPIATSCGASCWPTRRCTRTRGARRRR